jgi:hypothetical protein
MNRKLAAVVLGGFLTMLSSATAKSDGKRFEKHGRLQKAEVQVFDVAGEVGGGVLTPGSAFPPRHGSKAILKRTNKCLRYKMLTTGLPPGAYTNWWVVWNKPEACVDQSVPGSQCGLGDLLNPDLGVFWADGGVVGRNGVGYFDSERCIGVDLGFPPTPAGDTFGPPVPPLQHVQGPGLVNTKTSVVWLIIKYHGPASANDAILYHQTRSLLGACFEGANAVDFGDPFGVQCFDPQFAIFDPP